MSAVTTPVKIMTKNSERDINLRTLRRFDADVVAIKDSATQVAVYKFCSSLNEWKRKEIEGSLFVVCRKTPPIYSFTVINRLSTTNMNEEINSRLDLKLEKPSFLLYKNANSDIFCIWFYDAAECIRIASVIRSLINKCSNESTPKIQNDLRMTVRKETGQQQVLPIQDLFANVSMENTAFPLFFQNRTNNDSQPEIRPPAMVAAQPIAVPDALAAPDDTILTPELLLKQVSNKVAETENCMSRSPPTLGSCPPSSLFKPTPTSAKGSVRNTPLTMEQLKQTLVYLLQNDADFLHNIHTTYVERFHK